MGCARYEGPGHNQLYDFGWKQILKMAIPRWHLFRKLTCQNASPLPFWAWRVDTQLLTSAVWKWRVLWFACCSVMFALVSFRWSWFHCKSTQFWVMLLLHACSKGKFIVGGNWKCNPASAKEANSLLKDWKKLRSCTRQDGCRWMQVRSADAGSVPCDYLLIIGCFWNSL